MTIRRDLLLFSALTVWCVDRLIDLLPEGCELSPLQAKNARLLPETGSIPGYLYDFHGIGCWFGIDEDDDRPIDVDFHEGVIPMFDEWRAHRFVGGQRSDVARELVGLVECRVLREVSPDWYALVP